MKVKGIVWSGTKTEKYDAMRVFLKDVLGFKVQEDKGIVTVFELPNGDIFELLSPEAAPEIGNPKGCKVDFLVEDVRQAAEELKAAGIEVGPVYSEATQDWTNYRAPDGNLYGFTNMRFHPLSQAGVDKILFYSSYEANGYLSNWYPASIFLKGKIWPSSEHYYQAQKLVGTPNEEICRRLESPRLTFEYTRRPEIAVRPDWEDEKLNVMHDAVMAKFTQNPELKEKLLATGDLDIVENSPVDSFWGVGADGKGKNMLGRIIMQVRAQLRENDPEK